MTNITQTDLLATAHEILATAQLMPTEGVQDGALRVAEFLEDFRKQVLLEAAAKIVTYFEANAREFADELRRMALEPTGVDKGEG